MAYYYDPTPGPQQGGKYPVAVGPNYQKYGEQKGYIYDPYTDTYRPDPRAQQQVLEAQGLGPEKPQGLASVLLPTAAIIGGAELAKEVGSGAAEGFFGLIPSKESITGLFSGAPAATEAVPAALEASTAALPGASAGLSTAGAATAAAPYGTIQYGGEAVGTLAPTTAAAAPAGLLSLQGIGGAAGLAAGGYGMYNAYEKGDELGGALSGAGAGLGASMLGSALGIAAIPGLAPLAIGGGLIGLALGAFGGKPSTKEISRKRWGGLEKQGVASASAAYAANHPENDSGIWQEGKYKGEKWTFEKAVDLALTTPDDQANPFSLVYGNYKTFGNDWDSYSQEQKNKIIKQLASEGLYKGSKGDVVITNETRAREIKDLILAGKPVEAPAKAPKEEPKSKGPVLKSASAGTPMIGGVPSNVQLKPMTSLPSNATIPVRPIGGGVVPASPVQATPSQLDLLPPAPIAVVPTTQPNKPTFGSFVRNAGLLGVIPKERREMKGFYGPDYI